MSEQTNQLLQKLVESQDQVAASNKELTSRITDLTVKFETYIVKHDNLESDVNSLSNKIEKQDNRIRDLEKFQAGSEPVIKGVTSLNNQLLNKLLAMMIGAVFFTGGIMYFLTKGGV